MVVAKHPLRAIIILFLYQPISWILSFLIVASLNLNQHDYPWIYLSILGSFFVGLELVDRHNRKKIVHRVANANDERILQEARALAAQLGVANLKIEGVKWSRIDPRSSANLVSEMPSDQCVFKDNTLYLPDHLRSKLAPDDWKPLLASSIVFHYSKRIRQKDYLAAFALLIGPMILLLVILAFVGPLVTGGPLNPLQVIFSLLIIVSPFVIIFYGGYLITVVTRKLWLESDRIAARVVGKELSLRVLRMIGDMQLPDEGRLEKRPNYLVARVMDSCRPSLTERVENLTAMDSP